MAGRALPPGELRQVIEQEKRDVVAALERLAAADAKAREAEKKRQRRFRQDVGRLLLRGKGIVPVVQMAMALGWTRQMAHRAIREAEEES
jgi:hypothetical protein